MKVAFELKEVKSVQEFISETKTRRIGQLYFQLVGHGDVIARMITEHTDGNWLKNMIAEGKIYVPPERIICEMN